MEGGTDIEEEIVLGVIIERKRADDLASSIVDGRFMEQKAGVPVLLSIISSLVLL